MNITNCGILGNLLKCSKCKKITLCGCFIDKNGKYVKKGEIVYFCQDCTDKIEKKQKEARTRAK